MNSCQMGVPLTRSPESVCLECGCTTANTWWGDKREYSRSRHTTARHTHHEGVDEAHQREQQKRHGVVVAALLVQHAPERRRHQTSEGDEGQRDAHRLAALVLLREPVCNHRQTGSVGKGRAESCMDVVDWLNTETSLDNVMHLVNYEQKRELRTIDPVQKWPLNRTERPNR